MTTNLPKAQGELNRAKDCIEQMKNASGFEDYENSWSDFLNHLDKAWNKASAETLSVPQAKFDPFKGGYVNKRKNDQLLKYLDQARNSDTHSVQEIIEQQPETIIIGPTDPNEFIDFKSITIDLCAKTVSEYDGPPVQSDFIPPCIHAIAVKNHGTTFQPPVEHLGVPLTKEKDPVEIAELGLAFYQAYLDAIEAKFFS